MFNLKKNFKVRNGQKTVKLDKNFDQFRSEILNSSSCSSISGSSFSNDYQNNSIQSVKINHFSKHMNPIVSNDFIFR
jgi:hypothetical protein